MRPSNKRGGTLTRKMVARPFVLEEFHHRNVWSPTQSHLRTTHLAGTKTSSDGIALRNRNPARPQVATPVAMILLACARHVYRGCVLIVIRPRLLGASRASEQQQRDDGCQYVSLVSVPHPREFRELSASCEQTILSLTPPHTNSPPNSTEPSPTWTDRPLQVSGRVGSGDGTLNATSGGRRGEVKRVVKARPQV